MKRRKPAQSYEDHEAYPSAEQAGLTRRGFLRVALAGICVNEKPPTPPRR